jgi:DNA-binding GntR family transcriptional regulator
LREQIVSGKLRPGERVSLRGMAKSMGMSMAPVGEALRELTRDGLMELEPGWGARVRRVDIETLRSQHVLRTAIECEAARHCARLADDQQLERLLQLAQQLDRRIDGQADPDQIHELDSQLHLRIAELSRAHSLVEVLKANQLVRMLARGSVLAHNWPKPPLQHVHLVEALRTRDPEAAERAMREHCFRSMQLQLSQLAMGGFEM